MFDNIVVAATACKRTRKIQLSERSKPSKMPRKLEHRVGADGLVAQVQRGQVRVLLQLQREQLQLMWGNRMLSTVLLPAQVDCVWKDTT